MTALENKTILITGAAQGIGAAILERARNEGAVIHAVDNNDEAVDAAAKKYGDVTWHKTDITQPATVEALHRDTGRVDILFNVVGYVHSGTILDCDEAEWSRSININLSSMYRMIRVFLPDMLAAGSGNIINIASVVSTIKAAPARFAYSVTKGGVIALTKSIAVDYMGSGIRCNAICPGTIDTPSLHQRLREDGDYERNLEAFVNRQPMGRLGTAGEIASLAIYLASDDCAFMTGAAVVADGGMSL